MSKEFFFMAGLPRSGGTLMSSILNQNPDIYASPQSCLLASLASIYNQYQSKESKDSDQFQNIYNLMDIVIPTFYSSHQGKYIIDKNFGWLQDEAYLILQHHLKNPIRVICPVRDVLGILSSWNRLCNKDPKNSYDKEIKKDYKDKRPMSDRRADYFMNIGNEENGILKNMENMKRVLHPEFKDSILLVDYDDLTQQTEQTVDTIYNFLGIKKFKHDFNNINNPNIHTDHWGIKDHHKVKPTIVREDSDYSNTFSQETIKKYSGLEFWKQKQS